MGYDNYETSRARGEVITLYQFFYVDNQTYLYTDAERSVSLTTPDLTFEPIAIQHGRISSSGTLDKTNLEIVMPRSSAIADAFRAYPPSEVVNCVIRQMHRDDPAGEALVVWSGRVISAAWNGNEVSFSCEPISTSLRRTGLRRHYQLGCPLVLYGQQCAASRAAGTTPAINVIGLGSSSITLQSGWIPSGWSAAGKTADKFVGGIVEWDIPTVSGPTVTKRTVLQVQSGQTVVIAGNTKGLLVGSQVRMVLGCNHQMTDCRVVHNNIKNFGGQPFIPVKSPFGFSNNYY